MMPDCALKGYKIPCSGRLQRHHIINRGKARGNPRLRQALDCDELKTWVCAAHNAWEKWADTKEARAILLKQKVEEHGYGHMKELVDNLPWKVQPHEFRFDVMIGWCARDVLSPENTPTSTGGAHRPEDKT